MAIYNQQQLERANCGTGNEGDREKERMTGQVIKGINKNNCSTFGIYMYNLCSKVVSASSQGIGMYHYQRCDIFSITNGGVYWKVPLGLASTARLNMVVL